MFSKVKSALYWLFFAAALLIWLFFTAALHTTSAIVGDLMASIGFFFVLISLLMVWFLEQRWAIVLFLVYLALEGVVLGILWFFNSLTGTAATVADIAAWALAAIAVCYCAARLLHWYFKQPSE